MKELWLDLNSEVRNILAGVVIATICIIALMIANRVLFGDDPDITLTYKCTNEQAVLMEKSIQKCLDEGSAANSSCFHHAKITFCTAIKSNNNDQ